MPHASGTAGTKDRGTTHGLETLKHALSERVLLLDGAMGSMIQRYQLDEVDFRDHAHDESHDDGPDDRHVSLPDPV